MSARRISIIIPARNEAAQIRGSIEERAQQINHEIEQLVRQCPAQYLWGYNRYKGRGRAVAVPEQGGPA